MLGVCISLCNILVFWCNVDDSYKNEGCFMEKRKRKRKWEYNIYVQLNILTLISKTHTQLIRFCCFIDHGYVIDFLITDRQNVDLSVI